MISAPTIGELPADAVEVALLCRRFAKECIAALVLELRTPTDKGRHRISAALAVLAHAEFGNREINRLAEAQGGADDAAVLEQLVSSGALDDVLLPLAQRRFGHYRTDIAPRPSGRRVPLDDDDDDEPPRRRRAPLAAKTDEKRRPVAHDLREAVSRHRRASRPSAHPKPRRRHAPLLADDADDADEIAEPAPRPEEPKTLKPGPGEAVVVLPRDLTVLLRGPTPHAPRSVRLRAGRQVVDHEVAEHPLIRRFKEEAA